MKRCSECDFIYEDDQNLCDMDGHELVCDPPLQPVQVNGTATSTIRSAKSRTRRLALAVAIAMLVGALLSVGYSGLTREYVPQTTSAPSSNIIRAPQSVPDQSTATPNVIHPRPSLPDQRPAAPAASPAPSPSHPPRTQKTTARPVTGSPLANSPTPRPRSTTPGPQTAKSEPAKANHKKDSGIGGFLKKTGKILKRPFKL